MDDHWPVRNVFYERLRCWHLAWDSKLLSWQFDNTSIFWNKKKSYRLFLWLIPSKKYEKKFQCRNRHPPKSSNSFPWWRIWSLNDSAIFGIHNTSQKKRKIFFYLPVPPNFNLRWFECLDIPATIVTKERSNFLSLLYLPIFTSDDLNVWNSSNNGAELACFEPISLVFFFPDETQCTASKVYK